jgi:hypothetical protein
VRDSGANRALLLGVLSLLFGIFGPFAMWSSLSALRRMRDSRQPLRGEGRAQLGLVLGLVATVFMVVGIARFALVGGGLL